MQIHVSQKKKIVLYFKEDTIDSEKLQSTVPSLTSREQTVQAAPSKGRKKKEKKKKERKREWKRERKGEKKEKEEENKKEGKGKMEKAGLKSFSLKHTASSEYVP